MQLPRTEQENFFFCIHSDAQLFPAPFLQSACSTCFYLTISCLLLPKAFWCNQYSAARLSSSSFFDRLHYIFFFLSSLYTDLSFCRIGAGVHVCMHACMCFRWPDSVQFCRESICSLTHLFFLTPYTLSSYPPAHCFLQTHHRNKQYHCKQVYLTVGQRTQDRRQTLPVTFKSSTVLPQTRDLFPGQLAQGSRFLVLKTVRQFPSVCQTGNARCEEAEGSHKEK